MAREARVVINFRLGSRAVDWLDEVAEQAGCSRSDAMRASLVIARSHDKELKAQIQKMMEVTV